jgi:hypothetical protein
MGTIDSGAIPGGGGRGGGPPPPAPPRDAPTSGEPHSSAGLTGRAGPLQVATSLVHQTAPRVLE